MKAVIVYNTFSGKSKIKKHLNYITEYLSSCYDAFDKFESYGSGSISEFIINNGSNYDVVIAAGGDGTVHEAVNGLMKLENRPALGVIPVGTCNDLGKTLGLSKNIDKCLKILKENHQAQLDVSKINKSYFIYGLAAGSLTEISYEAPHESKMIFGKFAYYFYVLKALKKSKPLNIKVKAENYEHTGVYSVFLATNSRYLAGFRLKRKARLYLNDGKLQIVLIKNKSKIGNLLIFARLLLLGEFKSRSVKFIDAKNITISSNEPVAYNTDGELFDNATDIEVSVMHKSLNVIANGKVINKYFK